MSVRQYIGARYVPKFYEGDNGDLWENGIAYEALTIVRFSTNYFCSKKPVPATIGSPNNNPEYWANIGLLGDIVNDVAELQTRMNEAEDDIDDIESDATALTARVAANENSILSINNQLTYLEKFIKNKNILIIGDSMSDENILWNDQIKDVWVKRFREYVAPYNPTITNMSLSSRGYQYQAGGYSFSTLLDNYDVTTFDTIILFGGINDYLNGVPLGTYNDAASVASFWGALANIQGKIRNKNVFVISPIPHKHFNDANNAVPGYTCEMYRIALKNWAIINGFMFINGTTFPCISYKTNAFADALHVRNEYTHYMAEKILACILSGGEPYAHYFEVAEQQNPTLGDNITNARIITYAIENEVVVQIGGTLNGQITAGDTDLKTIPLWNTNYVVSCNNHGDILRVLYDTQLGGRIGVYAPGATITSGPVILTLRGESPALGEFVFNRRS